MNAAPAPLPFDQLDELLSADLDGCFDDAAADLGYEPDVARARVAATPGADERREALAAAQHLLATPDPLDEVTETRLRTAAVAAVADDTRHRRTHTAFRLVAAVAAALVVVVGIVVAVGSSHTSSSDSKVASAPAGSVSTPSSPLERAAAADYGSFASVDALSRAVLARRAAAKTALGTATPSAAAPSSAGYSAAANGSADRAMQPDPAAACRAFRAGTAAPGASTDFGTASIAGRPVVVGVARAGSRTEVTVYGPDCTVLGHTVAG